MSNAPTSFTAESTPHDACAAETGSCTRCGLLHAVLAEATWTLLFALLPFATAYAGEIFRDYGVSLPGPTMALLRFGRAMNPSSGPDGAVGFAIVLCGVATIGAALILASVKGSPEVKRAARFAAIVMMVVGVVAWLACAAAILIPYLSMQRSLSGV